MYYFNNTASNKTLMSEKFSVRSVGQLRIIGGKWRSRKLLVLDSPGLRPTPARLRETLFNWLAPIIQGARCIDCFAGSGALGLEALSRHAISLVLLEQNKIVSAQLSKNIQLLQAYGAQVVCTNSLNWLYRPGSQYDVVFIDPPFRQGLINKTVWLLEQYQYLAPESWIYIEDETNNSVPDVPIYWQLHRKKVAGQVSCRLYYRSILNK